MDVRIHSALTVYAFAVLGMFLLVAPWTPLWSQAAAALLPQGLVTVARSGWVRGAASGLGALDLWIALHAIVECMGALRGAERHEVAGKLSPKRKAATEGRR